MQIYNTSNLFWVILNTKHHWIYSDTTAKINGTTGVQDNDKMLPLWTTEQCERKYCLSGGQICKLLHALLSLWNNGLV